MECTAAYGELSRMTQFKDKRERAEFVSAGLFTYPALMAADILLYDTDEVPVGDDQRQHVELARDLAVRFNSRYAKDGEDVLVVPKAVIPPVAARVMDLQTPTNKMSKSLDSPQGTIEVLDDLKAVEKKVKRAVTDSDGEVRWDPKDKPGVTNLLSILGASTGEDPEKLAERYDQYGPLKADTAEAVVELLRPVQARYAEISADPGAVDAILATGAAKARPLAEATLARVKQAIGLLPRP
jgi:tryptophanyl-tRNA synthetase